MKNNRVPGADIMINKLFKHNGFKVTNKLQESMLKIPEKKKESIDLRTTLFTLFKEDYRGCR